MDTFDIGILVMLGLFTIGIGYLGFHLTMNPPESHKARIWYRIGFIALTVLVVGLNGLQTYRNSTTQKEQLNQIEKNTKVPPNVQVILKPNEMSNENYARYISHLSDEELAKAVQNTVVAIMDIANRAIAARKEFGEKRSSSSASKDILTRTYEEQEQQLSVELPFVSEYSVRFKDIAIALREELLNRLPLKDRTSISTTVNKALYTSVSSIGDLLQISGDLLRLQVLQGRISQKTEEKKQ